MRPRLRPVAGRRLAAAALAAVLLCPAGALGAPEDLRAERDALSARDAILAGDLARAEAALAAGRARLDRARARNRAALAGLEGRLRALYATPEPDPVIQILTGGDLGGALAEIDLMEAIGRRDRAVVDEYRASLEALRAAEAALRRTKDRLVEERRVLGVERQLVEGRLEATQASAPAASPSLDAGVLPALTTGGGLAIAAPLGSAAGSGADAPPAGTTRGLPVALLEGRGLPGKAPVDAQTGAPVDAEPAPSGPRVTRAYPRIGVVGPAAGGPTRGLLPTFTAVASWYGPGFTSDRLAGGEPYDPNAFSAASRTLRLGTLLRIAYGGRVVTVRVNDRGPYVRGRDLELSQAAAAALGLPGIGTVTAQILPSFAGPPVRA